ncbi:MAG: 3-deoxy-D-manno-octulosonic acid transferase [Rickettsiales bacterium]|jgi:3-deoxy-D-manno-octulosonic-acid transferase|nr:3-deoxy-D-manno-octulosonic acid transferase [Rickettsiales bacterium]
MKLFLYRLATFLAKPLVRPFLHMRRRRGLETRDKVRARERFGVASEKRPKGRIFWFNAASVGESNSIMPVVEKVLELYPDVSVLITTTTVTAAAQMEKRLEGRRAFHQFLPVDRRAYVDRFFDYWRPSIGFFVDSDFWPNLLLSARAREIPLVLLNGRVSDRSFGWWRRNLDVSKKILAGFIYGFGKSEEDRKKLETMGVGVTVCVGNLKYSMPPLPFDKAELERLRKAVDGRPVWIASSTHEGEEEIVLDANAFVRKILPDALLIIAPRHPARGAGIKSLVKSRKLKVAVRSEKGEIGPDTDVYVANTLGELGLFYSLAPVAFVGGSLLPTLAGHNPMEPALLRDAVISGPNVSSFRETYDILIGDNAIVMVNDALELGEKAAAFLADAKLRKEYADRAYATAEREAAVLDRMMERLKPILDSIR